MIEILDEQIPERVRGASRASSKEEVTHELLKKLELNSLPKNQYIRELEPKLKHELSM